MDFKDYFEKTPGLGILATADSEGNVDLAIYSRPHCIDDGTIAFIMADSFSHRNLQSNPKAAYLFKEDGPGYRGTRLYIEKTSEEKNSPLIDEIRRKKKSAEDAEAKDRFLVYFKINGTRPLTGDLSGTP
ncbi:MAG TPA: pyridoxamine 5'-phosphate oxidase family protein [Spirochaetota bacterium]|nr:pyridoxamine 5'-phosphate oxidase family protein [Spirochaetota bacterium]HPC40429.1 pyridoxamine 5'-phosphate oxidase family protein [Spirochaetota bacterium]HPL18861.1 pyridoxamine 5'-phosphate oxidase family protein [Spirochaetota bacterium]HQF06496.1 pyridoxamine 5'-phosphate oxidase family protein [Spirochaetota bacterium]HQH98081.1 pyridoxamine 5'-phosphate oxidase family protein [Spirochaetota bacterium]